MFMVAISLAWLCTPAYAERFIDVNKAMGAVKSPSLQSFLSDLNAIHVQLGKVSGLKTRLMLSDSDEVNAYATLGKDDEKLIVFNQGLISLMENDRDAIAAVMSHEFAHHGKNHIENTQTSNKALGVLGAAVGGLLSYKFGIGSLGQDVGQLGAKVISRSFSRDQEREADRRPAVDGQRGLQPRWCHSGTHQIAQSGRQSNGQPVQNAPQQRGAH